MPKKFNTNEIVESLINGQFKQARELTLKGLTDVYFMSYKNKLFSVGSEDLENAFKELAHRICSVMISIRLQTTLSRIDKDGLMLTYRNLFKSGRVRRTSKQDREDFDSAMEGYPGE